MEFTPKEKNELKAMLRFLIAKKDKESAGHCGFHINELDPILEEMVKEGTIKIKDTIHSNKYFLNK